MRTPVLALALVAAGCTTVNPGHLGLLFNPFGGGLQRKPLPPQTYFTGFSRIDDFDVTYSTNKEDIETTSSEGLALTMRVAVIYRPVASEIYDLDSEIGLNYYDEVIGPEFRSAARGVFARHSYLELLRHNEAIENEIEADLRRRTEGKHVEIASVTMEALQYAPEIGKAVQDKLVAEQDAARQKAVLENDAARRRMEIESQAEQDKLRADAALREKSQEIELARQQADLDKLRQQSDVEKQLILARAQTEEAKLHAEAETAEARAHTAENRALTPLAVMMHGYDALRELGGSNAHIYLGDWTHIPAFLFPSSLQPVAYPRAGQ